METVIKLFAILFLMSFVIERIVELILGIAMDKIAVLTPFKWALTYVAMAVAVVGTLIYNLDLFYQMGVALNLPIPFSIYGVIGTGIVVGGGSNLLNDIWTKFFPGNIPSDVSRTMNK